MWTRAVAERLRGRGAGLQLPRGRGCWSLCLRVASVPTLAAAFPSVMRGVGPGRRSSWSLQAEAATFRIFPSER